MTFADLFHGHPTIVVFFYTRCDNPLKCSLTITKLARVQGLLRARGWHNRIHTAAITYDPGFDGPDRLRTFGERRGVRLDSHHRMLRALSEMDVLRRHFYLGVSYIGSIVNRHRIEAYVLDAHGLVAYSFVRLRWNEQEIVERAAELSSQPEAALPRPMTWHHLAWFRLQPNRWPAWLNLMPALALALSAEVPNLLGDIPWRMRSRGLELVVRPPWIQPLLVTALLVNVVSAGLRARATGRWVGAYLVGAGALATIGSLFGAIRRRMGARPDACRVPAIGDGSQPSVCAQSGCDR